MLIWQFIWVLVHDSYGNSFFTVLVTIHKKYNPNQFCMFLCVNRESSLFFLSITLHPESSAHPCKNLPYSSVADDQKTGHSEFSNTTSCFGRFKWLFEHQFFLNIHYSILCFHFPLWVFSFLNSAKLNLKH